jgi:oxygen-independent coproporphyrinogen-3 oxidase
MYGIPNQTPKSFYDTLKKVISLKPEHISAYGLKIEPGTKFYKMGGDLRRLLPDEETERDMYLMCCELLERNGYMQYEISNFARDGRECRHNLKYWNCTEYIGLGVSAHSYYNNFRFSFKKDIKEYVKNFSYNQNNMQGIGVFDRERYNLFDEHTEIKPGERIGEFIMLSFRLAKGLDKHKFAKLFGKDFDESYYIKIKPFLGSGHIIKTNLGYALSREGMFVSNYILSRILNFD